MYQPQPAYPTAAHALAAQWVTAHYAGQDGIEAILLLNSCARGCAVADSCLDLGILVAPGTDPGQIRTLEAEWAELYRQGPVFRRLEQAGRFAEVHLDFLDGVYRPGERGWLDGPDDFELAIGNHLQYAHPLWQGSGAYESLRARWLPYYPEDLREARLAAARKFCRNNLEHIPIYAPRGLYFQCLERLRLATQEFLQALFIARRVYPIAYDKWIEEQLVHILHEPELFQDLVRLWQIPELAPAPLMDRARQLGRRLEEYTDHGT